MAEETPDRGNPDPSVVVTPAPAPAADASSLKQQDFAARIASAKTPAELRAVRAEAAGTMERTLKTMPRDFNGKPEATPAPKEEVTATPAEETPATPAEGQAADANETDDDSDTETDDGGEGPVEPISGKRAHLRLAQDDKVGRLAASYMKRNRDMPMEEAMNRARTQLGVKSETEQVAKNEEAPTNPDLPQTVEATQAAITDLRAQRKKANTELNFELASDLSDKIDDLNNHRFELQRLGEKKQAEQASAYDQRFSASESRATDLYEFAGDPKSAGGKRMAEIDADLEKNADPLFSSPDKPLRIAQMVAAELNIAPRRKGAPVAPAKAAAPVVPPQIQKKQVLPGGNSRTTPLPVNQPPAIDAKIKATPNTVQGLRALRKELGLSV